MMKIRKERCRLCFDGEIEPKDCVYYGEPNGCNSPIYSEYQEMDEDDVARVLYKVHEYLGELVRDGLVEDSARASDLADEVWDAMHYKKEDTERRMRNCDRPFKTLAEFQRYYIEHGCKKGLGTVTDGEITKVPWKSNFEEWFLEPID